MDCSMPGFPVHHQLLDLANSCHSTVSSSVVPFSSYVQSCPASGSLPLSQFFSSGGQSIGVSLPICHEVMEPDARIFLSWMLSFKPTFSLSSFTFTKRLFSSSLSALSMVSSAYLRLLIFLPAILIIACASLSPAFFLMYSAYKLNKQGDNIQPWHTPFQIWNQSVGPCPVLTVAFWPAYRFLKKP